MTMELYLHQGKQFFGRLVRSQRVRIAGRVLGCWLLGFFLSAGGLIRWPQPFSMALVSVMTGWRAAVMGLGSAVGYLLFWGSAGIQGVLWALLAALTALLVGKSAPVREAPLLIPAFSALWVAFTGFVFQLAGYPSSVLLYLLRVALAWASAQLFQGFRVQQNPLQALSPANDISGFRLACAGLLQARLESMAEVLRQTRCLLLETEDTPVDEEALLVRTRERACGGCPNRRTCRGPVQIPRQLLRIPLTENTALPFFCRKPGRMVLEIRRTQEQYRLLQADRQRRREYRGAVSQQYLFLSEYLREQSRNLPRRSRTFSLSYQPEVGFAARGREEENGDRFRHFSGPGGQYFLLLCDGMGTGLGAAEEGNTAAALLQGMLTAGFPPEHALESLNHLLALRGRAGAVTADLAQIRLDTGTAVLYKWGAAPSLLLRNGQTEKIGTAGPPPGIRGLDDRESRWRLSLRRGEVLIILSDGVDGEEIRRRMMADTDTPAGEMAVRLLEAATADSTDDATLAVVRLHRWGMLT